MALAVPLPVAPRSDICNALQTGSTGAFCLCNPLRNCHECILEEDASGAMRGSICLVCKNQKLLVNGACVDACPEGTAQRGLGRFNLRCDPALAGPPLSFLGDDSSVVHSDLTRYHRPNLNLGRFENEISVRFRTHRSTGLVLSTWDDHEADYFAVELDEGRVRASWDLGTGRGTVVTPEDHYADGQWHSLRVTRIDSFVSLTLDDRPSVHSFAPGTAVTLDVSHLFRMGFAETALHPSVLSVRHLSTPPPPFPLAHAQLSDHAGVFGSWWRHVRWM